MDTHHSHNGVVWCQFRSLSETSMCGSSRKKAAHHPTHTGQTLKTTAGNNGLCQGLSRMCRTVGGLFSSTTQTCWSLRPFAMGTLFCFSKAVISLFCFPFLHRVFPAVGGPLLFLYSLTPLPLLLSLVFLLLSLLFRYVFYGCVSLA